MAIEDDLQDIEILRLAITQSGVPWKLIVVQFAKDAIWYLGNVRDSADDTLFPKPSLILLDLALPGMSGMEFLTWARGETDLPPIVVLSYSRLQTDRSQTQRLGAKGYFLKSADVKETVLMIQELLLLSASRDTSPGQ